MSFVTPRYIVYGLFDPETGELRYVGKSCVGIKRIRQHWSKSSLAQDSHNRARSKNWCKSVLARGLVPMGEVLEVCSSAEEVAEREVFWIAEYRARGADLVNHHAGGRGGATSADWTPERRARASKRMMGKRNCLGKTYNLSPEQREALAERARRRSADPAVQAKISATLTGRRQPLEVIERRASKLRGRKYGPRPGIGGRPKGSGLKVLQDSSGVIYRGLEEAAKAFNVGASAISSYLSGRRPNKHGLKVI